MWARSLLARSRSHRRVTSSGRPGRRPSGSLVKIWSSGSTTLPVEAAAFSVRVRWPASASTAGAVIDTSRTHPVLVGLIATPADLVAETDVTPAERAYLTSSGAGRHRDMQPARQHGVVPLRQSQEEADVVGFRWGDRGAGYGRAGGCGDRVAGSQPQRTAWATARCRTTWAHLTREGPLPAEAMAVGELR